MDAKVRMTTSIIKIIVDQSVQETTSPKKTRKPQAIESNPALNKISAKYTKKFTNLNFKKVGDKIRKRNDNEKNAKVDEIVLRSVYLIPTNNAIAVKEKPARVRAAFSC
jgi:hypothetical protein